MNIGRAVAAPLFLPLPLTSSALNMISTLCHFRHGHISIMSLFLIHSPAPNGYIPQDSSCKRSTKINRTWSTMNVEPRPHHDDHSWAYLKALFATRFQRMDELCDWSNDCDTKSDQSLFLSCVIMWFQRDDCKDEILSLRTAGFAPHPLRFSVGRALHVDLGSLMATSWISM